MSSAAYIAPSNNTFDGSPTWVKLAGLASWETRRGRTYELDRTETGTATLTLYDTLGTYDVLGSGGITANLKPLKQIQIRSVNPIDSSTVVQYTGFIEDWSYQIDQAAKLMTVTINCVDAFDIISGVEVDPGPDGTASYAAQRVDDRLNAVLQDIGNQAGAGGWPFSTNIFTGNVLVQGVKYQPGTDCLTPMRDAADAEFPGVANLFIDKLGRVNFRGRLARLAYLNYAASATPGQGVRGTGNQSTLLWNAGDALAAQATWAWINNIDWMVDKTRIINACLCTPEGIQDWQVKNGLANQLYTDTTSIHQYGPRGQKFEGLIVRNQIPNSGSNIPYLTANQVSLLYAQYYVENYKQPHPRISRLTFTTQDPTNTLYAGHWKFMLNVEIDDVIFITTHDPGNGGFSNTAFFVEGIRNTVTPATGGYDTWEMALDVSPQAAYSSNPFGTTPFMAQPLTVVLAGSPSQPRTIP